MQRATRERRELVSDADDAATRLPTNRQLSSRPWYKEMAAPGVREQRAKRGVLTCRSPCQWAPHRWNWAWCSSACCTSAARAGNQRGSSGSCRQPCRDNAGVVSACKIPPVLLARKPASKTGSQRSRAVSSSDDSSSAQPDRVAAKRGCVHGPGSVLGLCILYTEQAVCKAQRSRAHPKSGFLRAAVHSQVADALRAS